MSKLGYFIGGTIIGALGVVIYNQFTEESSIGYSDDDIQDDEDMTENHLEQKLEG